MLTEMPCLKQSSRFHFAMIEHISLTNAAQHLTAAQSICVVTGVDADLTNQQLDKFKIPVAFECALTDVPSESMWQHPLMLCNHRNTCQPIQEHFVLTERCECFLVTVTLHPMSSTHKILFVFLSTFYGALTKVISLFHQTFCESHQHARHVQ